MPIHSVDGGYQWGQHGKVYKTRQKAIKQMKAIFANGYHESYELQEGSFDAGERDTRARQILPGLDVVTHHAGGLRYFSLQHRQSKKYLIKSMHVEKINGTCQLARHFFKDYNFDRPHEEIVKDASHLYGAVSSFRSEVDRIHQPADEPLKPKKKK